MTMGMFILFYLALAALLSSQQIVALSHRASSKVTATTPPVVDHDREKHLKSGVTRATFLTTSSSSIAVSTAAAASLLLMPADHAFARGRATLEQAYDRYSSRILDGGAFYKDKMKTMIAKDDFAGIKAALAEPPKKNKADRAKIDGGVSERAAQAGQFSDARVLVALDLLAAQFSDNSISPKTTAMKKEVDILRSVVTEMASISRQALGEENAGGGGFFGVGGKKKVTKSELSKRMKELYITGGTAWNKYAFLANEGIPSSLKKLPYL